ncbi:MAG TPA: response regulator, partial [Bradyrhizobium sp.]
MSIAFSNCCQRSWRLNSTARPVSDRHGKSAFSAIEETEAKMRTCLVVDDSSVIRKVARRILEGLDFQIVEAEDGEKALEICKRQLPEAILLDWNMPVMDGYEFLG